ncbi:MAG: V-type ATP synthase subunit D [Chlamydiae bacterium]|nr:V-type ATP synthase subunit D [Chlamydiota bacterium]
MADIKLTKAGLRDQQHVLTQLKTYLPTLQLKKYLIQMEVYSTNAQIEKLQEELQHLKKQVLEFSYLLTDPFSQNPLIYAKVSHIIKTYENIAGIEIPNFEKVIFKDDDYFLFDTPIWMDVVLNKLKNLIELKEEIAISEEKKRSLEKELRDVAIRVNLFDKVLIPRTLNNIKKIKVFLGDQELAAVCQAKVAKEKILAKREV